MCFVPDTIELLDLLSLRFTCAGRMRLGRDHVDQGELYIDSTQSQKFPLALLIWMKELLMLPSTMHFSRFGPFQ